jgi:hypothetical protein
MMNSLQVWKVTDCDWYAAASFDEAVKCAIGDGISREYIFKYDGPLQPLSLTEEELRGMPIYDADDGPGGENINGWDYLQQLQATGRDAIFFASTEW